MSKIKFNKEWYKDNKIAINCKTNEEAIQLFREFIKIDIRWNKNDNKLSIHNTYFDDNKDNICYTIEDNFYNLTYQYKDYFLKESYTIINFSDLEFESDIVKNESKITKTENEELGYDYVAEVDKSDKNHILRGDVKLNSGDIIKSKNYSIGLVVGDCISWSDGGWDEATETGYDLEWIIPSESLKTDKGYEVGRLLFNGELKDSLKDLIIYVEDDKPKKVETRIYHIAVSENRDKYRSFCISSRTDIEIGDIVSIDKGLYSGKYGVVISTKYKEISEEDIKKHYSNITKIK